ncbi:MAG TPA: PilN domain-containing protein [Actinomycetota bacterium]|nr:PilN domain-containing protein [Actinomycetota bacterium]
MRRIDLLPAVYAQQRAARRNFALVIAGGAVVFLLLVAWWFMIGQQIGSAKADLADVQATNAQLQAQIDELAPFAALEAEVVAKRTALQTVMVGDVDWPAIMTEVAMVIPSDVWLESLSASSGAGTSTVPTETAVIDIDPKTAIGRVTFQGRALTMPSVAKWLIRLSTANEFLAAYLQTATKGVGDDAFSRTVTFTNTIELSSKAASERFQGRRVAP